MKTKPTYIQYSIIMLIGLLAVACNGKKNQNKEITTEIDRVIKLYTPKLPLKLTDIESLSVVGKENENTIEFSYIWQEATNLMYEDVEDDLRELLVEDIQGGKEKDLSKLVELKANFRHTYLDKSGEKIISVLVTPTDYLK